MLPLLLALAAGCYKNTVFLGPAPGPQSHELHKTFAFWGALPEHEVPMDALCPQGVAIIEEQQTFGDGTVACCTLGFVRRVSVKVTCADGTAWRIHTDPLLGTPTLVPLVVLPLTTPPVEG